MFSKLSLLFAVTLAASTFSLPCTCQEPTQVTTTSVWSTATSAVDSPTPSVPCASISSPVVPTSSPEVPTTSPAVPTSPEVPTSAPAVPTSAPAVPTSATDVTTTTSAIPPTATSGVATPSGSAGPGSSGGNSVSQCNTGKVQCCNSVQSAGSPDAADLLGMLGIVLQNLDTPVGLTCTPLNVLGLGNGGSCTSQPVCCENNQFNGVINIGCTPINIGL